MRDLSRAGDAIQHAGNDRRSIRARRPTDIAHAPDHARDDGSNLRVIAQQPLQHRPQTVDDAVFYLEAVLLGA